MDDDTYDTSSAADSNYEDSVATQTENYTEEFDGWFKAPASANYRFFMACDDRCTLELDSTNPYSSGTTPSLIQLLEVTSAMTFRHYQLKSGGSSSS
jgi:hypothetical protein